MSYQATRIYNFCRNQPNSAGCPWPQYGTPPPYVDPCADPYAIGTTSCKKLQRLRECFSVYDESR